MLDGHVSDKSELTLREFVITVLVMSDRYVAAFLPQSHCESDGIHATGHGNVDVSRKGANGVDRASHVVKGQALSKRNKKPQ